MENQYKITSKQMNKIQHMYKICLIFTVVLLVPIFVLAKEKVNSKAVIDFYADMARVTYEDSLNAAKAMDQAIDTLLAAPSKKTLKKAKDAWLASRGPYQQTEVYRFANPIVDAWEGRVNSWPLDEGLIDYVDASYGLENSENKLYTANVIAKKLIVIDGKFVDASVINPNFLANTLHEAGGIEANVATGYHAIEFLLWGQDLNGVEAGAGNRPYTDYSLKKCTNGHCDRRREYLVAASQLLISDLEEMWANWGTQGAARLALEQMEPKTAIRSMLIGMGSLSFGELAGERMKLGLLLGDPEEEHDCFSDNTHNSHFFDVLGIRNVYTGIYIRPDGKIIDGPSLSDLIEEKDPAVDAELTKSLSLAMMAVEALVSHAEGVEAYDQMIRTGNKKGNKMIQDVIDALTVQAKSIERAISLLDADSVNSSDGLPEESVFE